MTKTIMVVSDDSDTSSTIQTLLKKNSYEVITAFNSDDCLKKLKNNKPNLLLIGSLISRGKILEAAKIHGIKVAYLITDESEKENLELYKNVIGFINEPIDINEFLVKVKTLLK